MDWETYQTAYQAADETKKTLVNSTIIPDCVAKLLESEKIDVGQRQTLIKGFALQILDESKKSEVLKDLKIPNVDALLQELNTCVKSASQKINDSEFASEIIEAEEVLRAIPKVRTMAQDMKNSAPDSTPTYSTTQEAILKEGGKD